MHAMYFFSYFKRQPIKIYVKNKRRIRDRARENIRDRPRQNSHRLLHRILSVGVENLVIGEEDSSRGNLVIGEYNLL